MYLFEIREKMRRKILKSNAESIKFVDKLKKKRKKEGKELTEEDLTLIEKVNDCNEEALRNYRKLLEL